MTVVGGGKLFGVNSADNIWYNDNYKGKESKSNWIQLPGALKQLDVDGTRICGANSANDFWCKEHINADWQLQ